MIQLHFHGRKAESAREGYVLDRGYFQFNQVMFINNL